MSLMQGEEAKLNYENEFNAEEKGKIYYDNELNAGGGS